MPAPFNDPRPFFRLVRGALNEPALLRQAVTALAAIEAQHGLQVLRDFEPRSVLPCGVYRPKRALSYGELQTSLRTAAGFGAAFEDAGGEERGRTEALHAFLSATLLIPRGVDFTNTHFLRFDDGVLYAWTQRSWGELVAGWANSTAWGSPVDARGAPCAWAYTDFYVHMCDEVLPGYSAWCDALLRVIEAKCRWQLAQEARTRGG